MISRAAWLIVNPAAGRAPLLRRQLPAILRLLAERGYTPHLAETAREPGSATRLARQAVATGASLVLAAGGDGTVHGVVQGLARSQVPLGVLPLGTANALARNLRLPLDPLAALERLLGYTPVRMPLGELTTGEGTCWFAVMAGCGPDGALAQLLAARSEAKSRLGRNAYYLQAARLFLTRRWPPFQVDYRLPAEDSWRTAEAVSMMVSRVPDLGGLFSGLTPRASMQSPLLHLHLLHAPAHLSLPAWFTAHRISQGRAGVLARWVTVVDAAELRCTPLGAQPVLAQADAEPLGTLPLAVTVLPDALSLLLPPG